MSDALREAIEIILSLDQEELAKFVKIMRIMKPELVRDERLEGHARRGPGKVIDLTGGTSLIKWFILVDYNHSDELLCRYVGDDARYDGAQWAISIGTSIIDRLQPLIEKAKRQLAREMAIRSSMERPQSEGRT